MDESDGGESEAPEDDTRAGAPTENGTAGAGGGAGDSGAAADAEGVGAPVFPPGAAAGPALREHWDEMVDEMGTIASKYRESGWEVLELHPGDVTVVTEQRVGFDVLLPDDEFARLADWVAESTFDEHEIYRAEAGIVFLLVVLRDGRRERAVCCPAYYSYDDAGTLEAILEAEGRLYTHLRNLAEEYVTVTHEDPGEFLPAESDGGDGDDGE